MNPFDVVKCIYKKQTLPVLDGVSGFMVYKILSMNPRHIKYCRYLNRYVFELPDQMFIKLCWHIIPPYSGFCPYLKETEKEYQDVLDIVQKRMKLSDNDMQSYHDIIVRQLKSDMSGWFARLGIDKKLKQKYNVTIQSNPRSVKRGLDLFM